MITVQGLYHQLGGNPVLRDVSISLPSNKMTAIIGPNGAGKSTLLDVIARQSKLQQGQLYLDDQDMTQIKPQDLALRMALVSQQNGIASRIRIRDLVGFGRWPHHQGRPQAQDLDKTAEALDRFDLNGLGGRFLDEVSGGQRQRAFVAMAYCQDTDWLLLDEPLNNLDLRYATALMVQLRALSQVQSKGIAIVIHDLNYALNYADHIVALKEGQLAFEGAVSDVANSENLTGLYDTPVEVTKTEKGLFVQHHLMAAS